MGRKCSVSGCKTGYKSVAQSSSGHCSVGKISVYSFPKEEESQKNWLRCLPNKIEKVTDNMGVCALHWPENVTMHRRGKYQVPAVPPSIFPNVPSSCIPSSFSSSTTPRITKKALSSHRTSEVDEMAQFTLIDRFKPESFSCQFREILEKEGMVFTEDNKYVLLSNARDGPIFRFSCHFFYNDRDLTLTYEAYHKLQQIHHCTLKTLRRWSELEELLRFIRIYKPVEDSSKKLDFLCESVSLLNIPKNSRVYSLENLSLGLSWCSKSRVLYEILRHYLTLPSLSTLRKLTRIAKNTDDARLFSTVFNNMEERNRGCILIIDEIYIKAAVAYRGGVVFGYAADHPDKIATTFLCIMVKCFFGSKSFLVKLLPCYALTAAFQFNVVKQVITLLESCGARVFGLVNDNNRVNQAFFGYFEKTNLSAPWIVKSPVDPSRQLYLIYDPVHLLKNIRNSWITESTKTLAFQHEGSTKLAHWSDLVQLHEHEQNTILKLSALTQNAVMPNNLQKQKVSLALQVFSEKTSAALKTSSKSTESWRDTSIFIDYVIRLWKVFNSKAPFQMKRHRDPDRAVISTDDFGQQQLATLLEWTERAKSMEADCTPRFQKITRDTAKAMYWTCHCLHDISLFLLGADNEFKHAYVAPGFFQQDSIEHHFAHFRRSAGCNYFITAAEIQFTHAIDRAKLMMEFDCDILTSSQDDSHSCEHCKKITLSGLEIIAMDDIPDEVGSLSADERVSIFYIAGYITLKEGLKEGSPLFPSSVDSAYTKVLDRGGLKYPTKDLCDFVSLCYLFVKKVSQLLCRKRLVNIFTDFIAFYHIDIFLDTSALRRITNILLKRHSKHFTCQNDTGQQRKIAKLTSTS